MSDASTPALEVFQALSHPEQELALQLVLCSGSLKELARRHQVSYPTIRHRLNKLIHKLEAMRAQQPRDPMAEMLADLVEKGEMTAGAGRKALRIHRQTLQQLQSQHHDAPSTSEHNPLV